MTEKSSKSYLEPIYTLLKNKEINQEFFTYILKETSLFSINFYN